MNIRSTLLRCVFMVVHFVGFVSCKRIQHKEGEVRLIGGEGDYEGTVLVFRSYRWGSICDAEWDIEDADVVCNQLGYPGAQEAVHGSKFGRGRKRIWMSNVECSGSEAEISNCKYIGKSQIDRRCRRKRRSAGVVCQQNVESTPSTSPSAIKMGKPTSTTIGKILSRNIPLMKDTSSSKSAAATTKAAPIKKEISDAITTSTTAPVTSTEPTPEVDGTTAATTTPKDIEDTGEGIQIMESAEDLATSPMDDHKYDILQADEPSLLQQPKLELRMAGGRYPWEGRLEVREGPNGEWGVICSEDWTLREAMVACRQMRGDHGKQALKEIKSWLVPRTAPHNLNGGFPGQEHNVQNGYPKLHRHTQVLANYFGGDNMNKIFKRIKCTGKESSLDECEQIRSENGIRCSKRILVAGVVCSSELPDLQPDLQRLQESALLTDRHLYYLTCSMEENCLASSAYVIRNTSSAWRSASRRLLKFSTIVHNIGTADFRPFRSKTQWEWHSCHQHYHSMEVFAHYDIIDIHGNRLAEGNKASFCLEDTTCKPGITPTYNCKGFRDQGLSVGCSDDYLNDIDCQWIDITDIKPGQYTFKMEINPSLLVAELNFDNNVATCDLWYSGYNARMSNCRFESLLPDAVP